MKNNKKDKKFGLGIVLKIIFFTLAFFLLLIAGTILFKANVNPDKVPDVFGYKPMIVLSGSMESSIYKGDLVFVKVVDTTTLKENDVIAFRNEENTVTTHRIVEIIYDDGKTYFRTKGDNNNTADLNLVSEDDVEGIYIWRLAGIGNFLMFMKEPMGLIVVLLVILVIGLLWLYFINKRDEKRYAKEEEQDRKEFEEYKRMKEQQRLKQDE